MENEPFDDNKSIVSMATHLSHASQFTIVTVTTDMLNIDVYSYENYFEFFKEESQFLILDMREEDAYD